MPDFETTLCGQEYGNYNAKRAHETRCKVCAELRCPAIRVPGLRDYGRTHRCTLAAGHTGMHVNRNKYNKIPRW